MSIPKIAEKIKSLAQNSRGKDILSIILIIIISFGSFFLGRNSAINTSTSQVQIYGARGIVERKFNNLDPDTDTSSQNTTTSDLVASAGASIGGNIYAKGNYLASSRGKKYYPIDCPAAQNIKESNRVYFKTAGEAETKGYTLSSSCN